MKRYTALARSAIKRAIDYVWPTPKPMTRTPIRSGPVTLKRGNFQRERKPIRVRSAKQARRQAAWNAITQAKIAEGQCCQRCGTVDASAHRLCGHHYLSTGRGGAWSIDNHVLVCAACHDWIHRNPAAATAGGWLMPSVRPVTPAADKAPSQRGAA